jgi:hypothetical protein
LHRGRQEPPKAQVRSENGLLPALWSEKAMKVSELIEELKKFPPEWEVMVCTDYGNHSADIEIVREDKLNGGGFVWIGEGE